MNKTILSLCFNIALFVDLCLPLLYFCRHVRWKAGGIFSLSRPEGSSPFDISAYVCAQLAPHHPTQFIELLFFFFFNRQDFCCACSKRSHYTEASALVITGIRWAKGLRCKWRGLVTTWWSTTNATRQK